MPSHERSRSNEPSPPERLSESHRYQNSVHGSYDLSREQRMSEKQMLMNEQTPSQTSCIQSVSASTRPSYVIGVASNSHNPNGKPLEGIASALPSEAVLVNSNTSHGVPDHTPQNCPGNGCSYHTHSWKLRRALQQDRDQDHDTWCTNERQNKPHLLQVSDYAPRRKTNNTSAKTSSHCTYHSTSTQCPYDDLEPISPPSQSNENVESSSRTNSQPPINTKKTRSLLILKYSIHIPQGIPLQEFLPSMPHTHATNFCRLWFFKDQHRPPIKTQMGCPLLDYVKNRIVEVMRTADNEQEVSESRRPQSAMSYSEERDQLQHMYRYPSGSERDVPAERPGSTGNGPPVLQGQRYSPAVTRYSPIPPRPSSAAERVPSRNSTPGEVPRSHKRGSEGHLVSGDWRDSPNVSSRASSRSVSPNNIDHPDNSSRKKTRSEGTFIPESTTDRAPVLLPQNSIGIQRSGSLSEAPRLSSNNPSPQVLDSQSASKGIVSPRMDSYPSQTDGECYKFRINDNRPDGQWSLMNNHNRTSENEPLARLSEPMNIGAASSTTVEPFSPSNRTEMPLKLERNETGTRQSPVTGSGSGSQEPSRNSPSASSQGQRSATSTPIGMNVSSSSGLYSPFGTPNGSVSSSTNAMFSSATTLPPPASPHVAYSSFSGMGNTYAYPFSALSMRSLNVSTTHSSTPLTNNSSSVSNSSEEADPRQSGDQARREEPFVSYDTSLPVLHSYLGNDLEELSGRTVLDDDSCQTIPILTLPGVMLIPGQILPLQLYNPSTISMMIHIIHSDHTFGLINSRQRFEVLETRTQSDGILIGKVRILPELQAGDPGECSKLSSLNKFAIPPPNLSSKPSNSFQCNQLLHRSSHKYNKYDFANYTWFPEFVYKMYDANVLMNRIKTTMQSWNKTMHSDAMPCNPKEFSYWVAANLPLDDRQRLELLKINEVTHRLRHELKILEECCVLTCRDCQGIIANREDIFSMSLQGPQGTYVNPNGYVHEAITVYKAKGLRLTGRPSTEQSWFPGYAWTIAECEVCTSHMGWRFTAVDKSLKPSKFWALCRAAIQNRINGDGDEPNEL
ncbi:Protein cereblon like protein [Argiope bruennichi]|uniref:Protein cereblon n=1 Tax=Argiope bruennichi TaxID=94029 RepID=A0A8T0EWE2_ARGBR|nr:Protein cereblon like protein [Argiope bruennichi]